MIIFGTRLSFVSGTSKNNEVIYDLHFKYITGVEMVSQKSSLVATEGITPFQQMVASCSGAIITSLFGKSLGSDDNELFIF